MFEWWKDHTKNGQDQGRRITVKQNTCYQSVLQMSLFGQEYLQI